MVPLPTERNLVPIGDVPPNSLFAAQHLEQAMRAGWIRADNQIPPTSIQPASLDLRLGEVAWRLRCSFLPDENSTVRSKVEDLIFDEIRLDGDGAVLEKDRAYLIPLREELRLPKTIRARANPKSSTGRLDVFTRVITDGNYRFDEIAEAYEGPLYLEVVSRSFAIRVKSGLRLNQLRLLTGDPRLGDRDIRERHASEGILYDTPGEPLPQDRLAVSDGIFLGVDLRPTEARRKRDVGYRAKENSNPIDLSTTDNDAQDYWEKVSTDGGERRIILQPDAFYLLLSAEGVAIPPDWAAEMTAYDPTAGELRTHYAGFFDPGFGYDEGRQRHGSRAALEVRARDVPFMVEHGQRICKLAFERLSARPEILYGDDVGSNYQGQKSMLSKHFFGEDQELRRFRTA